MGYGWNPNKFKEAKKMNKGNKAWDQTVPQAQEVMHSGNLVSYRECAFKEQTFEPGSSIKHQENAKPRACVGKPCQSFTLRIFLS